MPIFQKLINFDQSFSQLQIPPIIVNHISKTSEEEMETVKDLIYTNYSGDMINMLPKCNKCGKTKGEYAIGETCIYCGGTVTATINEDIEPILWFKAPEGVQKLINPIVWIMLRNKFKKSHYSILHWICDYNYRSIVRQPAIVKELIDLDIPRGYNNFVIHFDEIMEVLFNLKDFKIKKKTQSHTLDELIKDYRDCIFSEYLPLPNKSILIIENSNVGVYIDLALIPKAIDAILMMTGIDNPLLNYNTKKKELVTFKAIDTLADFYKNYNDDSISGKPGIIRKHLFGSRTHFSFRAVVSSITKPHRYDEIYIPWGVGIAAFRVHLLNKLLKAGYDHNQAIGFLHGHINKYSPIIDNIFQELIREAPEQKIPCIIQRNPSLMQGSAQLVGISKVKTDPGDNSCSVSILIVTAPNMDFDGDAVNFSLAIDNHMAYLWYPLAPHKNVMILSKPHEFANNIAIPKPVVNSISNWASSRKGYDFTHEQITRFNHLPTV